MHEFRSSAQEDEMEREREISICSIENYKKCKWKKVKEKENFSLPCMECNKLPLNSTHERGRFE